MQFLNWHVLAIIWTYFFHLTKNVSAQSKQSTYVIKEDVNRMKFGKLLNSVANVNEQRLNALKSYSVLDRFNVANGILRHADMRKGDPLIAVMIIKKKDPTANKLNEIFSDVDVDDYIPSRNTIQQITDYYYEEHNKHVNNSKKTHYNEIPNTRDENLLQKLLYDTTVQIDRVRTGNREEEKNVHQKKRKHGKKYTKIEETSDGEEIKPKKSTRYVQPETDTSDSEENTKERNKDISSVEFTPVKVKSEEGEIIVHGNETIKLSNNPKEDKKQILRLFKSCNKAAIKRCKKACKRATNAVCLTYRCSGKLKKSMKKQCKSECKQSFDGL